ncbi:hypothetical protein [Streptomyces sp. OE57]|uniref:hypothetical protein n=1 Tax=Streptomyces lacaronensis TaxID=3379885 RepID=UPI0039B788B8
MTTGPSGIDLVRQALVAAREQAKKNGSTRRRKLKRRTGQVVRRDGREPLGLGTAITVMMTERGMVAPAAGGDVLARFDDILAAAAPELTGHAQAVKFDADTGRLGVVPDAPAYGTKLRWSAPQLIAAANTDRNGSLTRGSRSPSSRRTQAPQCASRRRHSAMGRPRSKSCGRRRRGRRPRTAAVFAHCGGPVLSGLAPRLRPRLERPVPRITGRAAGPGQGPSAPGRRFQERQPPVRHAPG